MAGLRNTPTIWDIKDEPIPDAQQYGQGDQPLSPIDAEYRGYTKKGNLNPGDPRHKDFLNNIAQQISSGLVSQAGVENLATLNPSAAPLLKGAYSTYLASQSQNKMIGKYVNEGSPESLTQGTGGSGDYDVPPTNEVIPAVPAQRNYQGLADAYVQRGQWDLAQKAREAGGIDKKSGSGELTIPKVISGSFGIKSMDDVVRLSETEEGRKKLKEVAKAYQPYQEVTSYDESGNVRTSYQPKMDSKGASADKTLNKRVSDLHGLVEKSRILAVGPALKVLDSKISEYDKTGKIEGIGNLKNIKVSDWAKTQEGRYMTSVVQLLENEELRQASGLAVTEPEADRKERANALKAANTAEDYVRVYKTMIRPRWNNLIQGLKASSGNDALEVMKRRGIDFDQLAGEQPSQKEQAKPFTDSEYEATRRRILGR